MSSVYCPDLTVGRTKIVFGPQICKIWHLQRKIKQAEGPPFKMPLDLLSFRCWIIFGFRVISDCKCPSLSTSALPSWRQSLLPSSNKYAFRLQAIKGSRWHSKLSWHFDICELLWWLRRPTSLTFLTFAAGVANKVPTHCSFTTSPQFSHCVVRHCARAGCEPDFNFLTRPTQAAEVNYPLPPIEGCSH